MPVTALVDECPLYDLEPREPADPLAVFATPRRQLAAGSRPRSETLPRAARLAERRQPAVGVRAVRLPGRQPHGAPPGAGRRGGAAARATTGATPAGRSPSRSTATGAAWPATPTSARPRRSASAPRTSPAPGAEPLGLTNCLNFGNPEKPHVAWQLTRAVEGMGAACRALGVPVVGGNVSLYNEGAGGPDLPDAGRRHGRRAARPGARRRERPSRAPRERRRRHGRADRARSRPRCSAPSSQSCAAS